MNSGSCFKYAAKMVPLRAASIDRAESVRCTMNWSVHQYQIPRIVVPKTSPVQGKCGSEVDRHKLKAAGSTVDLSALQPPILCNPITVMITDPPIIRTA